MALVNQLSPADAQRLYKAALDAKAARQMGATEQGTGEQPSHVPESVMLPGGQVKTITGVYPSLFVRQYLNANLTPPFSVEKPFYDALTTWLDKFLKKHVVEGPYKVFDPEDEVAIQQFYLDIRRHMGVNITPAVGATTTQILSVAGLAAIPISPLAGYSAVGPTFAGSESSQFSTEVIKNCPVKWPGCEEDINKFAIFVADMGKEIFPILQGQMMPFRTLYSEVEHAYLGANKLMTNFYGALGTYRWAMSFNYDHWSRFSRVINHRPNMCQEVISDIFPQIKNWDEKRALRVLICEMCEAQGYICGCLFCAQNY